MITMPCTRAMQELDTLLLKTAHSGIASICMHCIAYMNPARGARSQGFAAAQSILHRIVAVLHELAGPNSLHYRHNDQGIARACHCLPQQGFTSTAIVSLQPWATVRTKRKRFFTHVYRSA